MARYANDAAMKNFDLPQPRKAIAISCAGLSKMFPVIDGGLSWRIMFGAPRDARQITALDNINLAVPKGQFVGILGHNGAGKSTLLRVLGKVYDPTQGSINVSGSLSGLFELGGLGNRLITGREYARRFFQFYGVGGREIMNLIADVHEFSELDTAFDQNVLTYSSGMAARLYFATATAMRYDVYLIDEILSVGDEHFQAKSWNRMRERFVEGASGVLVTHDWSAVLKLCERAHIMNHGRIIASGPSEKIVQEYLKIPRPSGDIARFINIPEQGYTARSNEDSEFFFEVERVKDVSLAFGYSIEAFRVGAGWEILLLRNFLPVDIDKNRCRLRLSIPRLPLGSGHYYLNLFLTSPGSTYSTGFKVYDSRTWANGTGIDLTVDGGSSRAMVSHAVKWRQLGAL
jgi:lipopolysaccharide transport system ATP-binding protein